MSKSCMWQSNCFSHFAHFAVAEHNNSHEGFRIMAVQNFRSLSKCNFFCSEFFHLDRILRLPQKLLYSSTMIKYEAKEAPLFYPLMIWGDIFCFKVYSHPF